MLSFFVRLLKISIIAIYSFRGNVFRKRKISSIAELTFQSRFSNPLQSRLQSREIARVRAVSRRATTADRYVGETKQNAEGNREKTRACRSLQLRGGSRAK